MKRLRWTLGIILVPTLLLTTLWWEENWRGRRMWEDTCAKLRAKGEPVELADIIPPMIPDEQNVAAAPIFAEVFVEVDTARLTAFVKALAGGNTYNAQGERQWRPVSRPLTSDDMSHLDEWRDYLRLCLPSDVPKNPMSAADEVLHYLSLWETEMREVREALRRPHCRWPLDSTREPRQKTPLSPCPWPFARTRVPVCWPWPPRVTPPHAWRS